MGEKIKVSVIIPVYNAEKYLRQCLDSVVNQTLREIEIICVDDGSTDGSLAILREYEAADSRVKVLTQKNQYAGVARNNGIAAATGEYYVFWDADDFFELDALQLEYEHCEKYHADICICGADRFNEKTAKYEPMPWILKSPKVSRPYNRISCENILCITSPCPWNKLFSATFVQKWNLLFQPLPLSNDVYFTLSSLALADTVIAVNKVLVHYRVGISSNLQSNISKMPTAICEALLAVRRKLETENCWMDIERSFFNCALENLRHNIERSGEGKSDLLYELSRYYWHEIGFSSHDKDYFAMPDLYEQIGKMVANAHPPVPIYTKIGTAYANDSAAPKVSVIIPAYNTEQFLSDCLNSVLEQTLQEIQIICVNDGSWDNSLQILEEYAARDDRISVISQRNAGLSAARNAALALSCGEYVCMLDSDDMLEHRALKELCAFADTQSLDVLFYGAQSLYMNKDMEKSHGSYSSYYMREENYTQPVSGQELFSRLVENGEYRSSACMQLVRRGHMAKHGICFLNGILHEDNLFTFENLLQAERAAVVNEPYYIRRVRENSIMTAAPSFANVYGYTMCYAHMMAFVLRTKLEESVLKNIQTVIDSMRQSAQSIYRTLTREERAKEATLSYFEMAWLELVTRGAGKAVSGHKTICAPSEAALIRASWSYRIGRFITWIPRKVRGGIRCYREHGWHYTWNRLLFHLNLKKT